MLCHFVQRVHRTELQPNIAQHVFQVFYCWRYYRCIEIGEGFIQYIISNGSAQRQRP